MEKQEIIQTLKESYSREIRKKLVKSIQADEEDNDIPNYKVINQIFSYVLSQLGWQMAQSTSQWDKTPLIIMKETFPSIETTKWYKDQLLTAKEDIEVEVRE